MVPDSTLYPPRRRGYWDDDATGGHIEYHSAMASSDALSGYLSMGPSKIEEVEPRKDPKFWAIWFREFLTAILPTPREAALILPDPAPAHRFHRCRSGPPPEREWKMKCWVQALKSQQS